MPLTGKQNDDPMSAARISSRFALDPFAFIPYSASRGESTLQIVVALFEPFRSRRVLSQRCRERKNIHDITIT